MLLLISRWAALAVLLTRTRLYKSSLRSLCFLTEMSSTVPGSSSALSMLTTSWQLVKVTEVSSSSLESGLENLVRVKEPAKQRWWPNLSMLRYDPRGSPNWNVNHFLSESFTLFMQPFSDFETAASMRTDYWMTKQRPMWQRLEMLKHKRDCDEGCYLMRWSPVTVLTCHPHYP